MRYYEFGLSEALKPSEYRPYVKGWNHARYRDIFKDSRYAHNRNGTRVYIPFESEEIQITDNLKSETYLLVEKVLKQNGYDIVDYVQNLCVELSSNRQFKIGKVLNRIDSPETINIALRNQGTRTVTVAQAYSADPLRQGIKNLYMAVISRHPYDIAGMSTGRGWTSCMNLKSGLGQSFVSIDVEYGSVVAYAVKRTDPDIKKPACRVMIKPFVDIIGRTRVHFGIEDSVYGTVIPGFVSAVTKWVEQVNSENQLSDVVVVGFDTEMYTDNEDVYNALRYKFKNKKDQQDFEQTYLDPERVFDIKNPSGIELMGAIAGFDRDFERDDFFKKIIDTFHLDNEILRLIITLDPRLVDLLFEKGYNLDTESQKIIVKYNGSLIQNILRYVKDVDESVLLKAVGNSGNALRYILDAGIEPSYELFMKSVSNDGMTIRDVIEYSEPKNITVDKNLLKHALLNKGSAIKVVIDYYRRQHRSIPRDFIETALSVESSPGALKKLLQYSEIDLDDSLLILAARQSGAFNVSSIIKYCEMRKEPLKRKVQVELVKNEDSSIVIGEIIEYCQRHGRPIYDEVLKTAVESAWNALNIILSHGIVPSIEIQIASVKRNPLTIRDLFDKGIVPDEKVQIAAIEKEPMVINDLHRDDIRQFSDRAINLARSLGVTVF